MPQLRLATPDDIPGLRALIEQSVRALSVGYYSAPQVESALRYVFGPDTQLIADRTYFVIEDEAGALVAAGGWSRRRTLYGGDQMKGRRIPFWTRQRKRPASARSSCIRRGRGAAWVAGSSSAVPLTRRGPGSVPWN